MHPNFTEFYQVALRPIGDVDKQILHNTLKGEIDQFSFATHWLIAIEGNPVKKEIDYYHWRVLVYPSNRDGVFHYHFPHFVSSYLKKIDDAISLTRKLIYKAKNDCLCSCSCMLHVNVG